MGKAELGDKQVCPNCGSKFYDLARRPAVCPKCATAFDPSEVVRVKRPGPPPVYETEDEESEDKRADKSEDGFEEDVEETAEIDAEASESADDIVEDDEGDTPARGADADALPPGFSEADDDTDLDEPAADDDDGVPLLEEDEEFPDEEIADVAEGEDEDSR